MVDNRRQLESIYLWFFRSQLIHALIQSKDRLSEIGTLPGPIRVEVLLHISSGPEKGCWFGVRNSLSQQTISVYSFCTFRRRLVQLNPTALLELCKIMSQVSSLRRRATHARFVSMNAFHLTARSPGKGHLGAIIQNPQLFFG